MARTDAYVFHASEFDGRYQKFAALVRTLRSFGHVFEIYSTLYILVPVVPSMLQSTIHRRLLRLLNDDNGHMAR
jgi:hypothetical protein